ncbi:hypothetical protein KCV03_g10229, partial [Aureobasidium melanogenum]
MQHADALDEFFAQYPSFSYNRNVSSTQEFRRMRKQFNWVKNDRGKYPPESKAAWYSFRVAMVQTFNGTFGTDTEDRRAWMRIGARLNIVPLPRKLHDLRQQVMLTHVNLCDMLDAERSGRQVEIFATEADLVKYTRENHRYFPKEEAYAGGLLKYLLREINNEYNGTRRPGGPKRGSKKGGRRGGQRQS